MIMKIRFKNAGFSLLEVMVSIAILAMSLLVLINFQGESMVAAGRAEKINIATMLAREKMAEFEIDYEKNMKKGQFPDESTDEGKFDKPYEDFSWKLAVKKIELPVPKSEEENIMESAMQMVSKQLSESVREVRLAVNWDELGQEQGFEVVTHVVNLQ
jgi:prepilin-type N-terminal cleavage/methylation domain-containing protein